jgi:hypothetical protein
MHASHFRLLLLKLMSYLQRVRDPEYAAMMNAQPKPEGRGREKAAQVFSVVHLILNQFMA